MAMPTAVMEDGRDFNAVQESSSALEQDSSEVATSVPIYSYGMAPLRNYGYLGTRDEIEEELDGIAAAMRSFSAKMPDQIMREVAAYTARLTELCVLLVRVESHDRQYLRVRTQQVDRFIAELDRQFKIASRLVEVQRQDLSLMGGFK